MPGRFEKTRGLLAVTSLLLSAERSDLVARERLRSSEFGCDVGLVGGLDRGVREDSSDADLWKEVAPRERRRGSDVSVRFDGEVLFDGGAASASTVDSRRRRALSDSSRSVEALPGDAEGGDWAGASGSAKDSRRRRALIESSRSMVEAPGARSGQGRNPWAVRRAERSYKLKLNSVPAAPACSIRMRMK